MAGVFAVAVGVAAAVLLPAVVGVGAVASGRSRNPFADAFAELAAVLGAAAVGDAAVEAPLVGTVEAVDPAPVLLTHVTIWAGATTPRKFRTAGWPSAATSVSVPPGISTTSWSPPCTWTVAPVTPVPLMRSSMIWRAWPMEADVGVVPLPVRA